MIFIVDPVTVDKVKHAKMNIESYLEFDDSELGIHKFQELLELVSNRLGDVNYTHLFTLTGKPVKFLNKIPNGAKALFISTSSKFIGFQDTTHEKVNHLETCVEGWLKKHKNDKGLVLPRPAVRRSYRKTI